MIANYKSTVMSPEQSESWLVRLKEIVVASEPRTSKKATLYLAAGCRFLVDMSETGSETVDDLLTDSNIARWSHCFGPHGRTAGTLGNYLGSLNRLNEARKGLPIQRRAPRRESDVAVRPLSMDEIGTVFSEAVLVGVAVAAAWLVAVGANRPGRSGVGSVISPDGDFVACVSSRIAVPVVDFLVPLARQVGRVQVPEGCWGALQAIAARHGWKDLTDVCRATHRHLALSEHRSLAEMVARHALTYDNIDSARTYLSPVADLEVSRLLRGLL